MDGQTHQSSIRPPLPSILRTEASSSSSPITQAGDSASRGRMGMRRSWGPECSHSTMVRFYWPEYKCLVCKRAPPFGWIYRCTMDAEALIFNAKLNGQKVEFEEIARTFSEQMTLGRYGADVRTEKYAFLNEITTEQLHSYTPSQLRTILLQRDRVTAAIAESRRQLDNPVVWYAGVKYPDDNRPWMPDGRYECQFKICHYCHNNGKDKTWVSLNAVLKGDILPSVATGYGFSFARSRPYVNVDIAKNLGCRPVPFPTMHPVILGRMSQIWGGVVQEIVDNVDSWFQASPNASEHSGETGDPGNHTEDPDDSIIDGDSDDSLETDDEDTVDLTPSTLEPVNTQQTDESDTEAPTQNDLSVKYLAQKILSIDSHIRPPWTPPPTPASPITVGPVDESVDLTHSGYYKRSPSSLKTNTTVRRRVFSSFPSISSVLEPQSNSEYTPEEMCDVGLVLSLKDNILTRACNIPLPKPDLAEEFLFAKGKISIGDLKHTPTVVQAPVPAPAVVHSEEDDVAVALMKEESVEAGIPDLVLCAEEGTTKSLLDQSDG